MTHDFISKIWNEQITKKTMNKQFPYLIIYFEENYLIYFILLYLDYILWWGNETFFKNKWLIQENIGN